MFRAALFAIVFPLIAQAEPQPAVAALMPYMDGMSTCFDSTQTSNDANACIGQGAAICMETEADGFSNLGMMFCTLAEAESWDQLLNREYALTMGALREMDMREVDEFAVRADSLRAAQRAWIPLRDADCALEYSMWGAGSMRQLAGASCQLQKTAERTVFLRSLRDTM